MAYIKVFQGTPLLMQLYLSYFGANMLGMRVEPWSAAALAFTLYASAFLGEIWRGCIQAIPRGQWEGARSLALAYRHQLRFIILPQALRIATPPTVGFLVQLLKGTSLASIIGFVELTRAAQVVNNSTFRPFTVYALVAAIYFSLMLAVVAACRPARTPARPSSRPGGSPTSEGYHFHPAQCLNS